MNAANDLTVLVDNMAGHWTESVLKILRGAGIPISVDTEIEAWRMLKKVLHAELHWQRSLRFSTLVSMSALMEQALRKAATLVAQKFSARSVPYQFKSRINQLARERRPSAPERVLYSAIVRQPALRAVFKEPTRTDFVPRLRVPAEATTTGVYAVV
jgi:hypothetical protein